MRRAVLIAALVAICLPASMVAAEGPTQDEVDQLKERVTNLESQASAEGSSGSQVPAWFRDFKFKGDMRLRYQGDFPGDSDSKDRHRARFRLRLAASKTMLEDQLKVAFRLASGVGSPTSTNQTFDDGFGGKDIWIDRAYLQYTPDQVKGLVVMGGKIPIKWVHTDMVWDSDVNPEGFWAQHNCEVNDAVKPFFSAGYMIADENSGGHDITMGVYQIGAKLKPCEHVDWTAAATYYDWDHLSIGGTGAFRIINVTNKFAFQVWELPFVAYADWLYNCGDDDTTPGLVNANHAYAAGVKVGKNKGKGDWSARYKYAWIEANATPGIFNDADFGGSNRRGHVIGGAYNVAKNVVVKGTVLLTEQISGPAEGDLDAIVQLDLIVGF